MWAFPFAFIWGGDGGKDTRRAIAYQLVKSTTITLPGAVSASAHEVYKTSLNDIFYKNSETHTLPWVSISTVCFSPSIFFIMLDSRWRNPPKQ